MLRLRHRQHYNHSRPHGKLGYVSPVRFAAQSQRLASFVEARQNHPTQLHTNHASDELSDWLEKVGLVISLFQRSRPQMSCLLCMPPVARDKKLPYFG